MSSNPLQKQMNWPRGLEQATLKTAQEWREERKDTSVSHRPLSRCPPHARARLISCLRPVFLSYYSLATRFPAGSSPVPGACETEFNAPDGSPFPGREPPAAGFDVLVSEKHLPARNLAPQTHS